MDDLKYLKKHYGEEFSRMCRGLFPTLLEQEGLLTQLITSKFAPTRSLAKDLEGKEGSFKSFIFALRDSGVQYSTNGEVKTPEELMKEAGYILYPECQTEEDIQSFRHYYYREGETPVYKGGTPEYRKGEELCTFNGSRLDFCRVWFAVKENVDEILRENFKMPERQDEYGTSVISIQFTKQINSTLSIKNRYNHTVTNPDATFSNNLENIIPGLTESFEKHYSIGDKNSVNDINLENYVRASDGRFYRSNFEKNNIHYCENNVIVDNGRVVTFDPSKYIVIDGYIVDLVGKTISNYDKNNEDSFPSTVPELERIDVVKDKQSGERIITLTSKEGTPITLGINMHNSVTKLSDPNLEEIKESYMENQHCIREVDLPNLKVMGNNNFIQCYELQSLNIPAIQTMGTKNFTYAVKLEGVNAPNLKRMEKDCFDGVKALKYFEAPKLQSMGTHCITSPDSLESISFPMLENMGSDNFYDAIALKDIYMPKIRVMGSSNFSGVMLYSPYTSINFPLLERMGDYNFEGGHSVTSIVLPNLKQIGNNNFNSSGNSTRELKIPRLEIIGDDNFVQFVHIKELELKCLKEMGSRNFRNPSRLTKFNAPVLERMGCENFVWSAGLKSINAPKLNRIEDKNFAYCDKLEDINMPHLQTMGDDNFSRSDMNDTLARRSNIKSINIKQLQTMGNSNFERLNFSNALRVPQLVSMGSGNFTGITKDLSIPRLTEMGDNNFYHMGNKHLNAPHLQKIGSYNFTSNAKLISFKAPKLEEMVSYNFELANKLRVVKTPNLYKMDCSNFSQSPQLKVFDAPNFTISGYWHNFENCSDEMRWKINDVLDANEKIYFAQQEQEKLEAEQMQQEEAQISSVEQQQISNNEQSQCAEQSDSSIEETNQTEEKIVEGTQTSIVEKIKAYLEKGANQNNDTIQDDGMSQ